MLNSTEVWVLSLPPGTSASMNRQTAEQMVKEDSAYKQSLGVGIGRHYRKLLPSGGGLHLRIPSVGNATLHWDRVDPRVSITTHVVTAAVDSKKGA